MIVAIRNILMRKLSPEAFRSVGLCWWFGKFYIPRRIASTVVRRNAIVHGSPSSLVDQLRGINIFAPTTMCRTMTKYGSDKGNSWHNYTTIYSEIFGPLRNRKLRIFELGLGRDHPALAESIGVDGLPGASLRGWREIFPGAIIYGGDIDRSILFTENRIQTFYCDQLDQAAIRDLWAQPALVDKMDLIIEDGLHTFEGNASFLAGSLDHVLPGGFYSIEDIMTKDLDRWHEHLPSYASQYPNCDFALLELPNAFNDFDNNMLIIRKRP
jgi:hypothetical protein